MTSLRTIAIALSLLVHMPIGYAVYHQPDAATLDAFDVGTGNDQIVVEQGIAIEGLAKLGDELQTIETADVTPVAQQTPPPLQEIKPVDELRDAITATESKVEEQIVKTENPPPEPPKPEVVEAKEQPQQVAMISEQSSGEAKQGSLSTTARTEYLGKLSKYLEKAIINPRSKLAGTVVVKFKVGAHGELLSREITTSSGSKVLDEAAVAALDRAAPFPAMPHEVANEPMVVSVPFKFITR